MAAQRAPRTFCPSETARALAEDWRGLMPAIREIASSMQDEGVLVATQKGERVDPRHARGPIRLALPGDRAAGA